MKAARPVKTGFMTKLVRVEKSVAPLALLFISAGLLTQTSAQAAASITESQQPTQLGQPQQPTQLGQPQQPTQLGQPQQPPQLGQPQQPPQLGQPQLNQQPVPPQATQLPSTPSIQQGALSFLDMSAGNYGKVNLEIDDAHLRGATVDKLHVQATNLDLQSGNVKGLNITVSGGHFPMFVFDQLSLNAVGEMNFDPLLMRNDKVLQFKTPVDAEVSAVVSQQSLNAFLSAPQTLEKLSITANKKIGMLASLFGANANNFGITLSGANVVLQKQNRVSVTTQANIGMGESGMPMPLELNAKLGLENGWVAVSDTHLNTNGSEISPTLSEMLVKRVNGLASWGNRSDDIQFSFTDLKVVPGKQFSLKGTAKISRLRFGQQAVPSAVVAPE